MPQEPRMKKESGFSLVELIISIAIISILVTIAVPMFVQWIPKQRTKSAAQDLYSNLQRAKVSSIQSGVDTAVTFTTGPDAYQIARLNTAITLGDYGSGVQYVAAPATATVTFNSRGFCDNEVTVSITNDTNSATFQVTVLTSGVVSVN
jgi:prepilin-type N-terminal cleavage/methylation domain-containing protein